MSLANPYTESHDGRFASAAVALVDDDEQICQALQEWLELLGIRSRYYLSAEAFLESVASEKGHWWFKAGTEPSRIRLAAAIVDLNLPGLQGMALAEQLILASPGLRVVVITAAGEEERQQLMGPTQGFTCLKKPFTLDTLEQALFPL